MKVEEYLNDLLEENKKMVLEIERLKEQLNDEIQEELKQSEIMVKKQKEIERLNNIINEIEAIIYNNQITGIEARLEIQERLDKLQELKESDENV